MFSVNDGNTTGSDIYQIINSPNPTDIKQESKEQDANFNPQQSADLQASVDPINQNAKKNEVPDGPEGKTCLI